jgi:hypothetical protein
MAKRSSRNRFSRPMPSRRALEVIQELLEAAKTADPEVMDRLLAEPEVQAERRELGLTSPGELELFKGLLCKGPDSVYEFYCKNGFVPPLKEARDGRFGL